MKKLLLALALISSFPVMAAIQDCSDSQQRAMTLMETPFPWDENVSVFDLACKTLPNDKTRSLGSLILRIEHEDYDEYFWRVVIMSDTNEPPIASYESWIDEDASIQVNENSIWLDTANYRLTDQDRAVGVRLAIGHVSGCVDGSYDNFLTLFIIQGDKLVPVLKDLPTTYWTYRRGIACDFNPERPPIIEDAKSYVQILKTKTNGYYDLRIVTNGKSYSYLEDNQKDQLLNKTSYKADLHFNGSEYDKGEWNAIPSPEYYK